MKKIDKILCAIDFVLMITCLILEFVPVVSGIRIGVLAVSAVFNLVALIYFNVRK